MRTTGMFSMARVIDELGRIVIPKEMRTVLGWNERDTIYIGVQDGTVFLKKHTNLCPVCRNPHDGKNELGVCDVCIGELANPSKG